MAKIRGVVESEIQDHDNHDLEAQFFTFNGSSELEFKDINVYPVHVNHSIPETYGLLIQDKKKEVTTFYVSDFKYDDKTPYEKPFDLKRLRTYSANSALRILCLDSTNILHAGKTASEQEIIKPLQKIISKRKGRIFITFFPSNVHRLQTFINLAHKFKRKVVYWGRSLDTYAKAAHRLGLIENYLETKFPEEELTAESVQRDDLLILLTGCQGDLKGALNRVVSGYDPLFKLDSRDTILFSSRVIPGNERRLMHIYNKIYGQGANIITSYEELIHASGHPGQEDLKKVITAFAPTNFVPIHGETYFLYKHISFVRENYPGVTTHLLLNFDTLMIKMDALRVEFIKGEPLPPTFILDKGTTIEKSALNVRRKMACNGMIVISIKINEDIVIRTDFLGLPEFLNLHKEELNLLVRMTIREKLSGSGLSNEHKESELKTVVRNYIRTLTANKPETIVHML